MHDDVVKLALGETAVYADSSAIALATVTALTSLLDQLKPLVGELAWRALYVRSLHLARSSFVKPDAEQAAPRELFAALQHDLAARSPPAARAAAEALLLAFIGLLTSLIGESLTVRLLHKAWDMPAAGTLAQEERQ